MEHSLTSRVSQRIAPVHLSERKMLLDDCQLEINPWPNEVSVLHNVAMLTLIVPKSDSVSVLREAFAAFEESGLETVQRGVKSGVSGV